MRKLMISIWLVFFAVSILYAQGEDPVVSGADRPDIYIPLIGEKRIALVANHTSVVGDRHLVDTLLSSGLDKKQIVTVFAPEHGFRGDRAAGVEIIDGTDPVTGIAVTSLYGKHKKPTPGELAGIELVVFDLQDVGARFYTYISTLHYVMEACAENDVPLLVLDRPNPNGDYVDGPVLDMAFSSFVGMHPIPVVYGLSMGELAGMINGEGWLQHGIKCDLEVVSCGHYVHGSSFDLPVPPSPNLSNMHAIRMYPSTCFFEGTVISEGRGTAAPFEVYGHPELRGSFEFIPVIIPGVAAYPKFENQLCRGADLRDFIPPDGWTRINLQWVLEAYKAFPRKDQFFKAYFDKLAGTDALRIQIEAGWNEAAIRASWQDELKQYKTLRSKYLIYDESE